MVGSDDISFWGKLVLYFQGPFQGFKKTLKKTRQVTPDSASTISNLLMFFAFPSFTFRRPQGKTLSKDQVYFDLFKLTF